MNLNALRSCGELSRLMTRPTQPVPAQFTAIRSLPALGRLVDGPLAVVGVGHVAGDVVGAELAGHLLGAVLVAVEDRAPHAERRQLPRRALAQPGRATGDDCGNAVEVHAAHATGAPAADRQEASDVSGNEAVAGHAVLRGGSLDGEDVDPVVHLVAGVALHPAEPHGPIGVERQLEQRLPQVPVGHRLAGACCASPAASTPPTTGPGSN